MLYRAICLALVMSVASASVFAGDDDKPKGKDKLFHIVAVKFKDGTSDEDKKVVSEAFRELGKKVHVVRSYAGGESVSVEKLNKDFNHCSVLTFKNIATLKEYAESAEHKAFVELLKKHMADVFVFDFWD